MNKEFWVNHWKCLIEFKDGSLLKSLERGLLAFFSFFYGWIIRTRNGAYDRKIFSSKKASVPVISIGNLSLGGTGKTVLTMWCAEKILKKNKMPVILSRGYGRESSENDVKIVSDGHRVLGNASVVGDEPYLMAQKIQGVPVVVGADRFLASKIAYDRFHPDCFLLDDGFQHRKLHRDLDIVCLDETLLKSPFVFPRGVMRENVRSLERADFIVIKAENGYENFIHSFEKIFSCKIDCLSSPQPPLHFVPSDASLDSPASPLQRDPATMKDKEAGRGEGGMTQSHRGGARGIAVFSYGVSGLKENNSGKVLPPEWLSGKNILACSGIANPESFENLIKKCGGNIRLSSRFSDHHLYTKEELDNLNSEASKTGSVIVTTEKDMTKMPSDFPAVSLCVKIVWSKGENDLEEAVWKAVNAK